MDKRKRVENEAYLFRDDAGAIVNSDIAGFKAVQENKRRRRQKMDRLESELNELKSILNSILQEKTK